MKKMEKLPDMRAKIDRKKPAGDQVYMILKEAIISLVIPPNTSLNESAICKITGVSRTPARRAIAQLSVEGWIDVFPQRGTYVSPIDLKKVYDGHFVRRAIELAVLNEAAKNWTTDWAAKAQKCIANQKKCAKTSKTREFQSHDEAFHRTLAECAGVEGVWPMVNDIKEHLDRVRYLAVPKHGHMDLVIEEHQAIIDSLNKGNGMEANSNLRAHLDNVYKTVEELSAQFEEYFI